MDDVMAPVMPHANLRGGFWKIKISSVDEKEFTASNFIPKDLLEIICILEKGEKHHSYKLLRNRNHFVDC